MKKELKALGRKYSGLLVFQKGGPMGRTKMSMFFSDFMDALLDYSTGLCTKTKYREVLNDIHDTYKYYPTTELMFLATMARIINLSHMVSQNGIVDSKDSIPSGIKWIMQEKETLKNLSNDIFNEEE